MRVLRVVLAEKPSVARDLARHVRADARRAGFFEGNGYQVTWALGHLVGLQDPGGYDPAWKKWSLDALPMLPNAFELTARGDRSAQKQLSVVKELFRNADEIIGATDAGREGELIFRYILNYAGCDTKPARRLWLKSLTPQAIRVAFQNLRPASEYDALYAAARCRSEADWIVGMNATRYYTLTHGSSQLLFSIGRVQTPLLAMIVRRDDAIRTFQPQPFWELTTVFRDTTFRCIGNPLSPQDAKPGACNADRQDQELAQSLPRNQTADAQQRLVPPDRGDNVGSIRFGEQEDVEAVLRLVAGQPFTVTRVQRKPQQSPPPQLFDLTELQREANRRFALSAARTLQIAQSLYEKKLISYPRTDSRYLSSDLKPEIPKILEQLREQKPREVAKLNTGRLRFTGRIVNDQKVADHHAIIPTGNAPSGLREMERKIYDAIVVRLIAVFYPSCKKEITTVDGVSNRVPFRTRGVRIVSPGWTELYPRRTSSRQPQTTPEDEREIGSFQEGDSGPHDPSVRRSETSPPKAFTENTLLGAMETAGKGVDDEELREALKEKGLGTPATRAAMIETLLERGYVQRNGKQLQATDLGRYLIACVRHPHLKSPELTGEWEAKLKQVEQGKGQAEPFMSGIADFTRSIAVTEGHEIDESQLGSCPQCGSAVMQGKRGFGCSAWRDGCTFVLWPHVKSLGIELTIDQVRELVQWGATRDPITKATGEQVLLSLVASGAVTEVPLSSASTQNRGSDMRRRAVETTAPQFSRRGNFESQGTRRSTDAPKQSSDDLGKCPLCGQSVVEQAKSYSCGDWKSGCKFVIWKTMAGKRISARSAQRLVTHGKTSLLKGFKSRAGRRFNARLKLVDGKVEFDFGADEG